MTTSSDRDPRCAAERCRPPNEPAARRSAPCAGCRRATSPLATGRIGRASATVCRVPAAARQRPLGSIAWSATSAGPRCAQSTSSAWNAALGCGGPPPSSPSRLPRPTTRDETSCRHLPRRGATRCSTRSPASSWRSRPRPRFHRLTRTPPMSSPPSAPRWAAAASGRQTSRPRVPAGGTTPPTRARCGRAKRWSTRPSPPRPPRCSRPIAASTTTAATTTPPGECRPAMRRGRHRLGSRASRPR